MLECRQTLKCEYVVQILSCLVCEAGVWKKSLLWALCCYFAPPHGAIMYPKTPAFSTAEIGKKYKTYVVAQSHRKNRDSSLLCFFFFFYLLETLFFLFLFLHPKTLSSMHHCKEAPIGSSGLCHKCDLAQRHSTLAIALRDAAGHCDVRSSQAGRGPKERGVVAWLAPLPPGAGWEIMLRWLTSCSSAIMTGGDEVMTRWSLELRKR